MPPKSRIIVESLCAGGGVSLSGFTSLVDQVETNDLPTGMSLKVGNAEVTKSTDGDQKTDPEMCCLTGDLCALAEAQR